MYVMLGPLRLKTDSFVNKTVAVFFGKSTNENELR